VPNFPDSLERWKFLLLKIQIEYSYLIKIERFYNGKKNWSYPFHGMLGAWEHFPGVCISDCFSIYELLWEEVGIKMWKTESNANNSYS
jgi:hypothetical protein